jgi:hypothetical protein
LRIFPCCRWPRLWILWGAAMLMLAGPSYGMPPLAKVQADNLAAAEILIGQVVKVGPAPASLSGPGPGGEGPNWGLFSLRIIHAVKSQRGLQSGDQVEVRFLREPETPMKSGPIPVRISAGDLVIVYANPRKEAQGLLVPVCAGFSVIRLKPLPPGNQAVPFPHPPR